jgi:hypothetical protein
MAKSSWMLAVTLKSDQRLFHSAVPDANLLA